MCYFEYILLATTVITFPVGNILKSGMISGQRFFVHNEKYLNGIQGWVEVLLLMQSWIASSIIQ